MRQPGLVRRRRLVLYLRNSTRRGASNCSGSGAISAGMITSFDFQATVSPSKCPGDDDATPAGATRHGQAPTVEGSPPDHLAAPCRATSCSAGVLTDERPLPAAGTFRDSATRMRAFPHRDCRLSFAFPHSPDLTHAKRRAADAASRTSSRLDCTLFSRMASCSRSLAFKPLTATPESFRTCRCRI